MSQKSNITGMPVKVSQEISDRYFGMKDQAEKSKPTMEIEETPSLVFHRDGVPYHTKYLVKDGGQPLCFLAQKEGSSNFTIGYVGNMLDKKTSKKVRWFLKDKDL